MSRMSNMVLEIQEMLYNGSTPEEIAETLGIPVRWVFEVEDNMSEISEPSDGFLTDAEADANALASVGWGMDEDYVMDNDYFDSEF
jgi:hypothetical protein